MADPVYVSRIYQSSVGGIRIERKSRVKGSVTNNGNVAISEFSEQSRQRLAWVCSQSSYPMVSMITLTYHRMTMDGKQCKADLKIFLNAVRRTLPSAKYIWFMEFQRRGAIHYHVLLSVPVDRQKWVRLGRCWSNIVIRRGGSPKFVRWFNGRRRGKFWEDERKPGGLARYGLKYALKTKQKDCPKGLLNCGRFWGASRGLVVEETLLVDYKGLLPDGIMQTWADDYAMQRNPTISDTRYLTYIY